MFCNLISVTSAFLDSATGRGATPETFKWSILGIRRINRLVADPVKRFGDELLMTLPQILIADSLAMGGENCKVHSRGLAQLIKSRGGLESQERPDGIESWICILCVVSSKAQTAYLDDLQPGDRGIAELNDWQIENDNLFSLLNDLVSWIFDDERYPEPPKFCIDENGPSVLFRTHLNEPEDDFEESYQMFILFYLSVALWELRDSVEGTMSLLCNFSLQCQQLASNYHLPDVTYILIRGLDGNRARKWQMLRPIKVLHRLSVEVRLKIKRFLFQVVDFVSRDKERAVLDMVDPFKISENVSVA